MADPTRTALITGASRGIGAALAKGLAAAGADIVIADLPGQAEDVARTAAAVEAVGRTAHTVFLNVTDKASIEAGIAEATEDRILMRVPNGMTGDDAAKSFPFVRKRGPVAFVMLSTAIPTRWFSAAGQLGQQQLQELEKILKSLATDEYFRVVVLHHPPEDYPTKPRKALRDRAQFREVLARQGAELVLHGHQHHSHFGNVKSPSGRTPVVGVPSASAALTLGKNKAARWNLFDVQKTESHWRLSVEGRALTDSGFSTIGKWHMTVNMPEEML